MGISAKSRSSKQGGFMVVMFLILMGLFLTFAAFAIDLGNIYLWKLRLDKASRAGVLAGLGRRGLDGWKFSSQSPSYSASAASQATKDNLQAYIDATSLTVDSNYLSGPDQMTTTVTYNVPTFLIHRLNNIIGFGFNSQTSQVPSGTIPVTSSHTAEFKPVNVVLAIDVSGSMLCPAKGSCACRLTNNCGPDTKLALLAQGVKNFVQFFNPSRDRISVIPFNLAAQRLYSLVDTNGNPVTLQNSPSLNASITGQNAWAFFNDNTAASINTTLANIAGSNTNHCDALAEAINELEALSTRLSLSGQWQNPDRTQLQPFVVFFTDGAPNAMRGVFPQSMTCRTYTQGNPSTYSATTSSCGTTDMYHYALEWVAPNPALNPPTLQYRGPAPFVARQTGAFSVPTLFRLNITGNSVAPNNAKVCGQHNSDPTQFESTMVNQVGGTTRRIDGNGCLPSPPGPTGMFSFSIPYTNVDINGNTTGSAYQASVSNIPISTANTTWRDPNWPTSFFTAPSLPAGATYGVQKYDELPYYCAVEAADYLRTQFGATIFTIGLGPPAVHDTLGPSSPGVANSNNCNDPLQDADDHVGRKDFFLARLAFARQMFSDPAIPVQVPNHYWFKRNPQLTRTVSSCKRLDSNNLLTQSHRLGQDNPGATAPPNVNIGYTSSSALTDGDTTYQDLRPPKPLWADGQAEAGATVRRRIDTQGEYFPTNDPDEIPAIFGQIAKSILLRSTS